MRVVRFAALSLIIGILAWTQLSDNWESSVLSVGSGSSFEVEVDSGQPLEAAIEQQLLQRSERFNFALVGAERSEADLKKALKSAAAADDYTAYIIDSYYYTIREQPDRTDVELRVKYRESAKQTAAVNQITDEALSEIIHAGMNDHEKVKAIHDWVVDRVSYDHSLERYTAYEALTNGKAVCQGYALLMHNMLTKAGLQAVIAEGEVDTGSHAWNIVQLDGHWYHLDATWDDAAIKETGGSEGDRAGEAGAAEGAEARGVSGNTDNGGEAAAAWEEQAAAEAVDTAEAVDPIRYRYYLLTDEQLRQDHRWTKSYPKAMTVYADALRDMRQAEPEQADRIAALEAALGLDWLSPERTADSVKSLAEKLADMAARHETEWHGRYMQGATWSQDIRTAVRQAGIQEGYTVRSTTYGPGGTVLLELKLLADAEQP